MRVFGVHVLIDIQVRLLKALYARRIFKRSILAETLEYLRMSVDAIWCSAVEKALKHEGLR